MAIATFQALRLVLGGMAAHAEPPGLVRSLACLAWSLPETVKLLVVRYSWSVLGSANIDNRSFGINDEVNLAALDPPVARTLTANFADDVAHAARIDLAAWESRSVGERMVEWAGWVVERQQ